MDKLGIIDADLQSARRKSTILKKILIEESEIKKHNEYNCLRYLFSQLRGRFENACKGAKEFAQKSLHAMKSFAFQKKQEVPYNCDEILRRFNGSISFSCNEGNFKLDKKGLNHILNGEFDEMGLLTGGGHTKESIKKLEDIMTDHLWALEQVANENNDRLWLNKWLNAFSPNDREVDSMQLQPEK